MKDITRLILDKKIKKILCKQKAENVLDVGGKHKPYKKYLNYKKYVCVDINPENHPDIIADAHDLHMIKKESYDFVLATEVLEHCYNPQQVINEFNRILKKKSVLILSTPFLYPYHPDPKDYYRFTINGLQELCKRFDEITVIPIGNRFLFMWEMITWKIPVLKICNPLLATIANYTDKNGPITYITIAEKRK